MAETPVDGWKLDNAECNDGEETLPLDDINLLPGGTVNCTFNNVQLVPSVIVTKTVGTDKDACGDSQELHVDAGTDVYFCFTLFNSGNVTLTDHMLIDTSLGVTVTFTYPLGPGDDLQVTNKWLADNGKPTVLGPVKVTQDIVNTVVYESPVGEEIVEDRSTARVVLPPTALDDDDVFPDKPQYIYLPQIGS